MHHVYILRDSAGKHYIGMTSDLLRRIRQHQAGGTQTTRRMQGDLSLVASRSFSTSHEAAVVERRLKSWKNPAKATEYLRNIS